MSDPAFPSDWAEKLLSGDRRILAKAVTLVESTRSDHRDQAEALIAAVMPHTGKSTRIGISGVPGVGKSTFIEAFGQHVTDLGHRIAVLAVDPSSKRAGGSILGDKTRMEVLSRNPAAFIRPSPAGSTLGGVARRTRESMLLCEAAGFDVILVETVGVGQSETAVADMTDMFLLLLLPAGGDELQGLKKGIVELADMVLVNKADGDLAAQAKRTAADYHGALRLLNKVQADWTVPVLPCSALTGQGVDEAWTRIQAFRDLGTGNGGFQARRRDQARSWLWDELLAELTQRLRQDDTVRDMLPAVQKAVADGDLPAPIGARQLVDALLLGRNALQK
ncbi:methylmalonyl Co-A mutase-associated GTPase MeaB [Rhodospirillaceae bacterium KN72]|uniref:Methylmalonyl Co-A mutase-associated GTPase MeaB n=1 Tax=Pacificispira spongiicola TaxID=2729598 RepID=A0A7Y0E0R9_9PROT|nr:methylmalonyl Co-A mutase-associated GTPase MeaB [Pacificispira spongiicola]